MSTHTVLYNGTVITGFAQIPDSCVSIAEDGSIEDIFYMKRFEKYRSTLSKTTRLIDVKGAYITPGFIDTHIHGIGGYGTEDRSAQAILGMSECLADVGVTSFIPTVYTDTEEHMIASITAITDAMGREKGAKIIGIHLEGPFIASEKKGAQEEVGISPVDIPYLKRLLAAGSGQVISMTVAPEIKNMRELALTAQKEGIVLMAGHTNASYENIMEGIQCGILHATHFFNAMSPLNHRDPGAVGAILIHEDMQCEIIADGVHVHPQLVKLLIRDKPVSNIVLVTDSLKPAKQAAETLMANGREVVLKQGAFFDKANPDLLRGSALTMLQGIKNLKTWEVPMEDAIQMACSNPARIYSLKKIGQLIPGNRADITVFDNTFTIREVFINGTLVREHAS